jgi:hypothetical protein
MSVPLANACRELRLARAGRRHSIPPPLAPANPARTRVAKLTESRSKSRAFNESRLNETNANRL